MVDSGSQALNWLLSANGDPVGEEPEMVQGDWWEVYG